MNWPQAISAMRSGASVQRACERYRRIGTGGIAETGEEPCRLADAFTLERQQVQVFQGSVSRCLFVPRDDHVRADDWMVVE